MSLEIEIIADLDKRKEDLSAAWSGFKPFSIPQGFALERLFSWWQHYGRLNNSRLGCNMRPKIVLIHGEGQLKGILPLMLTQRKKKRILRLEQLEFFTQSFNGQYLDLIHSAMSVEEMRAVFRLLGRQIDYDLINLSYLREDSPLLKAGIGEIRNHAGKVVIPLDMSYEKIRHEVYSKNLRHVLNKFSRRINESGDRIGSEILEGKESIDRFKDGIKKVSLSKLNEPGMHSLYQDPDFGDLYYNSIVNRERPFCSVYSAGNRLLAYNMGYIDHDVVYALDAAYDRDYAEAQKIGLGILAYDRLVFAYAGKYRELDMGFGLDEYKYRFSKQVRLTKSLIIPGNSIKGKLFHLLFKGKPQIELNRTAV